VIGKVQGRGDEMRRRVTGRKHLARYNTKGRSGVLPTLIGRFRQIHLDLDQSKMRSKCWTNSESHSNRIWTKDAETDFKDPIQLLLTLILSLEICVLVFAIVVQFYAAKKFTVAKGKIGL